MLFFLQIINNLLPSWWYALFIFQGALHPPYQKKKIHSSYGKMKKDYIFFSYYFMNEEDESVNCGWFAYRILSWTLIIIIAGAFSILFVLYRKWAGNMMNCSQCLRTVELPTGKFNEIVIHARSELFTIKRKIITWYRIEYWPDNVAFNWISLDVLFSDNSI